MVGILVGGSGETVEYLFRFGVMGTCVSVKKVGGSLVWFSLCVGSHRACDKIPVIIVVDEVSRGIGSLRM